MIIEMTGVTNSSAFQKLEDESKRTVLKELKVRGASHRQLERVCSGICSGPNIPNFEHEEKGKNLDQKNVGFNEKKTKTKTKIFKKKFSIVMNSPVITGKDNGQERSLRLKNCNVCKGMQCL